jgi:hypothetical protein
MDSVLYTLYVYKKKTRTAQGTPQTISANDIWRGWLL